MLTTVTTTRVVPAAPDRVWGLLVDPHSAPHLQPEVEVRESWGSPGDVGSGYRATVRKWPLRVGVESRIEQAQPLQDLVVVQRSMGRLMATSRFSLAAAGDRTRLEVHTSLPGLVARCGRRLVRRDLQAWLDRLVVELRRPLGDGGRGRRSHDGPATRR